jgi:hypothetical protein
MFFSIRRFIDNVVGENVCFICGADPNSVGFNDEHVIPDWILREYNLHNRRITLPNEAGLQYGQYKVACCVDCNSRMSVVFERPISNLVRQGLNAFTDYLLGGGLSHVFQWLALIYLKTHLKDRHLRLWLDRRKSDQTVADLYDWGELHHIHCIARAFYTGADIAPEALGSIVVWPARNIEPDVNFDYADCYEGSTILLRLGEIALLAVLNDSCATWNLMQNEFGRLAGPLSSMQLRELMARMAYTNIYLPRRPRQYSTFENQFFHRDFPNTVVAVGKYTIAADFPDTLAPPRCTVKPLARCLRSTSEGLPNRILAKRVARN